jgi:glutamyl-tRNA reductase
MYYYLFSQPLYSDIQEKLIAQSAYTEKTNKQASKQKKQKNNTNKLMVQLINKIGRLMTQRIKGYNTY